MRYHLFCVKLAMYVCLVSFNHQISRNEHWPLIRCFILFGVLKTRKVVVFHWYSVCFFRRKSKKEVCFSIEVGMYKCCISREVSCQIYSKYIPMPTFGEHFSENILVRTFYILHTFGFEINENEREISQQKILSLFNAFDSHFLLD